MSHYYLMGEHGAERFRPLKKDGTEYKRFTPAMIEKAGAVPSVTGILGLLGESGGLIQWAANQGVDAGMEAQANGLPFVEAKRMCKDSMDRAATEGTAIHDAIEAHLNNPDTVSANPIHGRAQVDAASWLAEHGVNPPFRCEHCLIFKGEIDGVRVELGGTTDLIQPGIVADWKTVEDKGYGFRKPKWSEAAQLAMYRLAASEMGLCEAGADCWNLYFDRATGRLVHSIQWTEAALSRGLSMIALAVTVKRNINLIEACVKRGTK